MREGGVIVEGGLIEYQDHIIVAGDFIEYQQREMFMSYWCPTDCLVECQQRDRVIWLEEAWRSSLVWAKLFSYITKIQLFCQTCTCIAYFILRLYLTCSDILHGYKDTLCVYTDIQSTHTHM